MRCTNDVSLLLVEGDQATLDICNDILTRVFPEILIDIARLPIDALSIYKERKHDIVVTDMFEPRNYGIKIAKEVCDINSDVIVIFITTESYIQLDTLKHSAEMLCLDSVIHKPIDFSEVIVKINEAIRIVRKRAER